MPLVILIVPSSPSRYCHRRIGMECLMDLKEAWNHSAILFVPITLPAAHPLHPSLGWKLFMLTNFPAEAFSMAPGGWSSVCFGPDWFRRWRLFRPRWQLCMRFVSGPKFSGPAPFNDPCRKWIAVQLQLLHLICGAT